jgi:hypothetical protein
MTEVNGALCYHEHADLYQGRSLSLVRRSLAETNRELQPAVNRPLIGWHHLLPQPETNK